MSKVMFISGSIGMGHVTRDLAMANEFRKLQPDAEVVWLAGEPAVTFLKEGGEASARGRRLQQRNGQHPR